MKSLTLLSVIFLCCFFAANAQQPDAFDPMLLEKHKDDLEKIRASIERSNTGPTLPISSPPQQEKSKLKELIESLEPINSPSLNSNPATSPIAPTGEYNTSDTSRINIDDEIFNTTEVSKRESMNNTPILIGVIVILLIVILLVLIKRV